MKQIIMYIILSVILIVFIPINLQCQYSEVQKYKGIIENADDYSFDEIQQEAYKYFRNRDKGRGSGFKQFKRWEHYNKSRLGSNGKIINVAAKTILEYENYIKSFSTETLPTNYDPGYWESLGPFDYVLGDNDAGGGLGRVNCFAFHPWNAGIYYAGTPAGGLWKKNGLDPWEPITDGLPIIGISGIALDHNYPDDVIYILSGDGDGGDTPSIGILKTSDGGTTWQSTNMAWNVNEIIRGYKLLMHPSNPDIQYIATSIGIYKTEDGWISKNHVQTATFNFDIEFKPDNPEIMYATGRVHFYRSDNGGNDWDNVSTGLPIGGPYRIEIGVTPDNPNVVYLLYGQKADEEEQEYEFKGLYMSLDGGINFGLMSDSPNILGYAASGLDYEGQFMYDLAIAVSPTDFTEIHIGGINCWKSSNQGASWNITSHWLDYTIDIEFTHADIHSLEYHPIHLNYLYCGSDGGVYRTSDGANTWVDQSSGLAITQFYGIGISQQEIYKVLGGTQDLGGITVTTNNKIARTDVNGDGFESFIDYNDSEILYHSTQSTLHRSEDNGGYFGNITPNWVEDKDLWKADWTMHHFLPFVLYLGHDDIWKSTNSGTSWNPMYTLNDGGKKFSEISQCYYFQDVMYGVTANRVYKTTDAGVSWSNVTTPDLSTITSQNYVHIAVDPHSFDKVYVALDKYVSAEKVYISTDAGASWNNWSGTLPNIPVNCIVCDNTTNDGVYIGTDVGVFYRDNTMTDWVPFFNELPNVIVNDLEINYTSNKLVAGTFGRGLWQTNLYGNCQPFYILSNENNPSTSSTQYYAASDYIISNRTIYTSYNNTSVSYKAGNYIQLNPGFNSQSEAKFEGVIGPCSETTKYNSDFNITDRVSGGFTGDLYSGTNK